MLRFLGKHTRAVRNILHLEVHDLVPVVAVVRGENVLLQLLIDAQDVLESAHKVLDETRGVQERVGRDQSPL